MKNKLGFLESYLFQVIEMRKRIFPRRKVCERFHLTYELKGAQKAVDYLCRYYQIRRMRIVLNGNRARNYLAVYGSNKSYFRKDGLSKRTVLHELYHHIVYCHGLEMTRSEEERGAVYYAKSVLDKAKSALV